MTLTNKILGKSSYTLFRQTYICFNMYIHDVKRGVNVAKWSDLTEEQKERRRATHRRNYEKHRAKRLGYQKDYRENMTPEQKERELEHTRRSYAKSRGDPLDVVKYRERKPYKTYGENVKGNIETDIGL